MRIRLYMLLYTPISSVHMPCSCSYSFSYPRIQSIFYSPSDPLTRIDSLSSTFQTFTGCSNYALDKIQIYTFQKRLQRRPFPMLWCLPDSHSYHKSWLVSIPYGLQTQPVTLAELIGFAMCSYHRVWTKRCRRNRELGCDKRKHPNPCHCGATPHRVSPGFCSLYFVLTHLSPASPSISRTLVRFQLV